MNLERAAAYAARHEPRALLVRRDGVTLVEQYAGGFDAATPHALFSGTKSFWGVCASIARDEGLLDLDEPVGATFAAWARGERAGVTLRQLLSLTSGIGFGGLGNAVPGYAKALAVDLETAPGSHFAYGGIALQVFGAVFAEKVRALAPSPHAYLGMRVFDSIGLRVGRWRTLADGTHPLPTGAFLCAREWAKYGELLAAGGVWEGRTVVEHASLTACFEGSHANPRYGLGFWLSPLVERKDVVYASGSGGQALYVLRADRTVVVRFGNGGSFKHETFLKYLLGPEEAPRVARKTRA